MARAPTREPKDPMIAQLVKARVEQGLTIEALAKRMGYSVNSLYGWENECYCPKYRAFHDWANALGFRMTLERLPTNLEA